MRIDHIFFFADAGTPISDNTRISTLHLRQKREQNAIAHAYGCVCRWWGHISYHEPAKLVHMYITRHLRQKQGQTPLRMRMDVFADGGDTYIVPQACHDSPHVYYETSTAKTRTKRHCACVWICLQMVGHLYRTTSLPR